MIRKYFHNLDYVIGAEYYLTHEKLDFEYRVDSSNFYVDECVDLNSIGFSKESGNYVVFKLIKKNIDTYTALLDISKRIRIPVENIHFLGLKDRYASTSQHIFIKKEIVDINELTNLNSSSYKIVFQGYVSRKPCKKVLVGNRFRIIIDNIDDRNYSLLKIILTKIEQYGLPSYYGYQRFGVKRFNTHILGKYLVLNRLDLFLHELLHSIYPCEDYESVLKRTECRFDSFIYENIIYKSRDLTRAIELINSITHSLFIDAYTSYLYNLLLNRVIDKHGWIALNNNYPTIGCIDYFNKYYRDIAFIESISESKLSLFKCWFKNGLFKPNNLLVNRVSESSVLIEFKLDRGLYASIVLRELFKDNYILC